MPKIQHPDVELSYISGFKYAFRTMGREIVFNVSAWTGSERVFVDGEVVSEKRGFSKTTRHHFLVEGSQMEICLTMKSLAKADWKCSLQRDGELIRSYHIHYQPGPRWVTYVSILLGALLGLLFAIFEEYWYVFVFLLVALVLALQPYKRNIICDVQPDA